MRHLFVMDPPERLHPRKDTTFVMMYAVHRRGGTVSVCRMHDLSLRGDVAYVRAERLTLLEGDWEPGQQWWQVEEVETVTLAAFDAVHMRPDPPVTMEYVYATHVLDLAPESTVVINRPASLRDCNEKLYALRFPELIPETIVTADKPEIIDQLNRLGGKAVLKPLDLMGGLGIFLLRSDDSNLGSIIDTMTLEGRRAVMVQQFLPEVSEGDKRIIVIEGEPVGALLRIAQGGDLRSNMHVGGRTAKGEITGRDREICAALKDDFSARGLHFVGLDVIGGRVTEINITSPTGLQEIDHYDGIRLEDRYIDSVEGLSGRSES